MADWAVIETQTAHFGDKRLQKRMQTLLTHLGDKPRLSIPAACRGWAETQAAYRFFDNDKVSFEGVLEGHSQATLERIRSCSVVLLSQDTTMLDYSVEKGKKGIGTLKITEKRELLLHPTLALTPQRLCLGVVAAARWQRIEPSPRSERRYKAVDEKESYYWVDAYQNACAVQALAPDTLVVSLCDSEGDIYEFFSEHASFAAGSRASFIIRAGQDRLLAEAPEPTAERKLLAQVERQAVLGTLRFKLPRRSGRKARRVKLRLRAARLRLKPPQRVGYKLPEVEISVVLAREEGPPSGVEAIEWLLLTDLPIETLLQAKTMVAWYGCRWQIEIYFRTLKQGCQVEALRLEQAHRRDACLALYMIVAWRVLFITMLARLAPEAESTLVLTEPEWRALYVVVAQRRPPDRAPPLAEAVKLLARLGGYLGRKHDGMPGAKPIWVGMQRLHDLVWALSAHQKLEQEASG